MGFKEREGESTSTMNRTTDENGHWPENDGTCCSARVRISDRLVTSSDSFGGHLPLGLGLQDGRT